jgi:hypothetical protein
MIGEITIMDHEKTMVSENSISPLTSSNIASFMNKKTA